MKHYSLLQGIATLPEPFDRDRAASGAEAWLEAADKAERKGNKGFGSLAEALLAEDAARVLLECLFGNSPFLSQSLQQDPITFYELAVNGPDHCLRTIANETKTANTEPNREGLGRELRMAKRRTALITAVADITGIWNTEKVTQTLSDFAALALCKLTEQQLREAAAAGDIDLASESDPARSSGFTILGMGKLGARELNYSSDIDLIVLYDQEVINYRGRRTPQDCYVRITRNLVKGMQERTADGYIFRTDLRLRPDPGATPVALSMEAAENYYEGMGQNWERAAMIKARPVAGDIAAGKGFLDRIRPFVWRKHLDFAAIEDIHSIKRQMHAHKGHAKIAVAGHNVKLGAGGIREIEFFAQTQQLIAGGRDPSLRDAATCDAIRGLAKSNRLDAGVAEELVRDYWFLRRLEHRIQMVADEQTHVIPETDRGVRHIATFLGYETTAAFRADVTNTLSRVQCHYAALFEQAPTLGGSGNLVFTGAEDDPDTLKTLSRLGFSEPPTISGIVRRWHHGRYRATRSQRAREKLTALMPVLLEALGRSANANQAFLKFDEFLGNLPAGVQLFSLFLANPGLLDLVAEIMGTSPHLADILSRHPTLLDAVISGGFDAPLPGTELLALDLKTQLDTARDFQDVLDISRRWANERKFQCGVQVLRDTVDVKEAGAAFTRLAEVLIRASIRCVGDEFALSHGHIAGAGIAVIAMGKLGGREMTSASDLDLIFIYDFPAGTEASDGGKPLVPSQYFSRLSQRVINAITAMTPEGQLYEVDMRLRPSGRAGPLAVTLPGFQKYQSESAWTWEHMALTRARVIDGPAGLQASVKETIDRTLRRRRDPAALALDVDDMRMRLEKDRPTADPWSIKYVRGGLVDAEFICQFLQLRHGAENPGILDPNTFAAFSRMSDAEVLEKQSVRALIDDTLFLSTLQGLLRLCTRGSLDEERAPDGLRRALIRAGNAESFDELRERLISAETNILKVYNTLVGEPADKARQKTQ